MATINSRKNKVKPNDPTQKKAKKDPKNKMSAAEKAKANKKAAEREKKKTPADKKAEAERAKVLAERRDDKPSGKKKPKLDPKARLAARQKELAARAKDVSTKADKALSKSAKKESLHAKWLGNKQKVESANMTKRYAVSRKNIEARKKARLATMKKRTPKLKDGKLVTPKVDAVKAKIVKFTARPVPKKPKALQGKPKAAKA